MGPGRQRAWVVNPNITANYPFSGGDPRPYHFHVCTSESLCDPQTNLERFSKLGLGTFNAPGMERWSARCGFFAATRLAATDALIELRDTCLAVFTEAKQFWTRRNPTPFKQSWPTIPFVTAGSGDGPGVRALTIHDWDTLAEGATQCSLVAQLDQDFKQWCTKYHLTERWLADSALTNLAGWSQDPVPLQELCWPYPGGTLTSKTTAEVGGHRRTVCTQSATGLGMGRIGLRLVLPRDPPPYNPLSETASEHDRKIQEYRRELEAGLDRLELPRRRAKRARTASPSTHFVWLVQSQLLGWTQEQIAAQHDDAKELDASSVGQALRSLATTLGMNLRPSRGRRRQS